MDDDDRILGRETVKAMILVASIVGGLFLAIGVQMVGSRVFRAYDRWECKQWCGPTGAKRWSEYGGCECKP